MEKFAYMFRDIDAKLISDISHFKNHPWDKTIKEKGKFAKIDYVLAIDKDAKVSLEDALESLKERKEMLDNFPVKPTIS